MICLKQCNNKTNNNYCKTSTCVHPEKYTLQEEIKDNCSVTIDITSHDEILTFIGKIEDKVVKQWGYSKKDIENVIEKNKQLQQIAYFDKNTTYKKKHNDYFEMATTEFRKLHDTITQLQQENSELKRKLELKSGLVLARQNIEFCNENTKLQQEKEDLIKFISEMLKEMEKTPTTNLNQEIEKCSCMAVADVILSKLKGDDKEC